MKMLTTYLTKNVGEFGSKLRDGIQTFYWKHWPYDWRPRQVWYRIKCFLWHRYSTTKPRYLPHTWCDRDTLLAHTMFEILSKFIEQECSPGHVEWYGEEGHKINNKYVRDEMQELYDWWHKDYIVDYPAREETLWEQVATCSPISLWQDAPNPGEHFTWKPRWRTDSDELRYRSYLADINSLEVLMTAELLKRMHRLVDLLPYMWT